MSLLALNKSLSIKFLTFLLYPKIRNSFEDFSSKQLNLSPLLSWIQYAHSLNKYTEKKSALIVNFRIKSFRDRGMLEDLLDYAS